MQILAATTAHSVLTFDVADDYMQEVPAPSKYTETADSPLTSRIKRCATVSFAISQTVSTPSSSSATTIYMYDRYFKAAPTAKQSFDNARRMASHEERKVGCGKWEVA